MGLAREDAHLLCLTGGPMASLSLREQSDMALRRADAAGKRAERAMAQAEKAVAQAHAAIERAMMLCDRLSRGSSN